MPAQSLSLRSFSCRRSLVVVFFLFSFSDLTQLKHRHVSCSGEESRAIESRKMCRTGMDASMIFFD